MERNPIADRIEWLIKQRSSSIKDFAQTLGVQRSSLSHILSGRNKPSLDFILNVLESYPNINEKWLLHGKGEPTAKAIDDTDKPLTGSSSRNSPSDEPVTDVMNSESGDVTNVSGGVTDVSSNVTKVSGVAKDESIHLKTRGLSSKDKSIRQIVVLYDDGSFETFLPQSSSE